MAVVLILLLSIAGITIVDARQDPTLEFPGAGQSDPAAQPN